MINFIIMFIAVILQILVIWYGYKMWRMLNPVRYWTTAWLLYTVANLAILGRRIIGIIATKTYILPDDFLAWPLQVIWSGTVIGLIQVGISSTMLAFGFSLKKLYDKYFGNGVKIEGWKNIEQ